MDIKARVNALEKKVPPPDSLRDAMEKLTDEELKMVLRALITGHLPEEEEAVGLLDSLGLVESVCSERTVEEQQTLLQMEQEMAEEGLLG